MSGTAHEIEILLVHSWDEDEITDLYRVGGWWKDGYNSADLRHLIRGSFAFAVAVEKTTGRAVGMGRVISDGVSDGYIQDLVVLPEYRKSGIGKQIVRRLIERCKAAGLSWIGLVAEPDSEEFYILLGFRRMEGYVPLIFEGDG